MTQQNYDLLSIGAHPDDVEVGSQGVLIDLSKRGILKNIKSIIARNEATWLSRCHSIAEIASLSLAMIL
jgi:hypothetical protein